MKQLLLCIIFLIYGSAIAQNGVLTNAILLQREGSLVKALAEINKASEHEKTKGLAKTWYYKGVIYRDIFLSENSDAKTMVQDALIESTDFFKKAIQLDEPKGEYRKMSQDMLLQNYRDIINRGVAQFQTGRFQDALNMFKVAQTVCPADTNGYSAAYSAAYALGNKEEIKRNLDSLLKIQPNQHFALSRSLDFSLREKDHANALKVSQTALQSFPSDRNFQYGQYLSWMALGKTDDAQKWLTDKLKTSPFETDYLLWQALLYKEVKNQDQELLYYQKIVALEAQHFTANYNAALIYVDRGNKLSKNDDPGNKAMYAKALDHAKRSKYLASDEELPVVEELIRNLESIK